MTASNGCEDISLTRRKKKGEQSRIYAFNIVKSEGYNLLDITHSWDGIYIAV